MHWTQLIDTVAERSGQSKAATRAILEEFIHTTHEALAEGDTVRLRGLGSFSSSWRAGRTFRSVRDSRLIKVDGRYNARFRSAKALRERLANLSPQHMQDPRHQEAWRVASALVGDLDLYHGDRAPKLLRAQQAPSDVRARCSTCFGSLWQSVVETYETKVPSDVRDQRDHLAEVALETWSD